MSNGRVTVSDSGLRAFDSEDHEIARYTLSAREWFYLAQQAIEQGRKELDRRS